MVNVRAVWKYELAPYSELSMPTGAKILDIREQHGRACLWALVNPTEDKEVRRFHAFGTGMAVNNAERLTYLGSAHLAGGDLVFHVFEETAP